MNNCILIDGNSLLYRMFYGMRPMNSPKGVPTSAIFGFVNLLLKIQKEYDPEYIAVAFDRPEPTFRHEAFEEYKAGREQMPEDLVVQLDAVKELLEAMNIRVISKPGFEADDIIGTIARMASEDHIKTQIITGDRDSFQLVSPDVSVLYTATRNGSQLADVNEAYIDEKYGVTPEELKTVKALMGDKSDNIPGIAGVGEKTALKLVKEYHTLENLYEHTDDLKGKMKERIINGKDDAYDSLFLGTIDTKVPLDISLNDLKFKGILTNESRAIMQELGFRSILSKLESSEGDEKGPSGVVPKKNSIVVSSDRDVIATLSKLSRAGCYIVNYFQDNTPENDPYHAPDEGGPIYLALEIDGFYYFIGEQNLVRHFISGLSEIPNADDIQTVGHNFKNLEKIYNRFGSTIVNLTFDIYIASYLNDPSNGQYDLSSIALRWLDEELPSEIDLFGKGKSRKTVEEVGIDNIKDWLVSGCEVIKKVKPLIEEKIDSDGMEYLFNEIEMALEPVLASMEEEGFTVDLKKLKELSNRFEEEEKNLEKEIYDLAGTEFKIGSPKQLGEVLFDKLELPVIKRTKTGYSTSADVLEELKPYHPIISKILDWRMINKLNSTYGKGLIAFVDPKTDKIYSTFQQTVTATGRISSTDPNLQNIPVKTEMGREIRKVFTASGPDRILVDADYSQIELRVLAAVSGDENLIEAFEHHADIHAATAAKVFNEDMDDVTPLQRSYAKTINFGLIYGKQAFTLAKDLDISRKEAQDFIDTYFATYPKIHGYLEKSIQSAKDKGYSETIWGRRRYIPEITSRNRMTVQAGERMAQNMPIQGAAADIIKIAMIKVYKRLRKERLDARLILQVHDELIIDSSIEDAERVKELLVEEMENAVKLDVPMEVEAHTGFTWYEAK